MRRVAARLSRLGVKSRDFVTIELPRNKEYTAVMYAVWMVGALPLWVSFPVSKLVTVAITLIAMVISKKIRHKKNLLGIEEDGVTETQSPDETFFDDDKLLQVLGEAKDKNQQETVEVLREEVNKFENGGAHHDDATMLALSFKDYLQVEPPESKTFFLAKETFDEVTDYVAGRSRAAGCDEKSVGQIVIATSEILANIDLYAYENGGEIEVLTKCRDRRMTIIFKDNGKPFNPLLVQEPDVTLPLNKRNPGGLGVFIVKKLMSETAYAYKNSQNILTIEMDF